MRSSPAACRPPRRAACRATAAGGRRTWCRWLRGAMHAEMPRRTAGRGHPRSRARHIRREPTISLSCTRTRNGSSGTVAKLLPTITSPSARAELGQALRGGGHRARALDHDVVGLRHQVEVAPHLLEVVGRGGRRPQALDGGVTTRRGFAHRDIARPLACRAATVSRPIGPPPVMRTRSAAVAPERVTPCMATASGSVSAAVRRSMPGGTGYSASFVLFEELRKPARGRPHHPVAHAPTFDGGAHGDDVARPFVAVDRAGNTPSAVAEDDVEIGPAHAAVGHVHQHLMVRHGGDGDGPLLEAPDPRVHHCPHDVRRPTSSFLRHSGGRTKRRT